MSKVLYISYDGLTDPLGQSQVLPYLQQLSKSGFRFTILSFEKEDRFNKEKEIVQEITKAAGINWVPLSFTTKPPILSKIYDRHRMRSKAVKLHKKENFDLVHCRSYVAAETGVYMKQKFGVKMLFDMRGFWADERVDNGQWNTNRWLFKRIYRYYKKKERNFLLEADGIVSLTQTAKDYLLKKAEYKNLNIEVIPCCADLNHFDYKRISIQDIERKRTLLGIPKNVKIISYLGSVGGWYMTKEMFSFFRILIDHNPEYVMLILTKDNVRKITEEALAAGIPIDKIFITYSNREQLPEFLALSSCSIFFIRDTFSKIASSPTKHAELMGMGIPVICNEIGDTGHIVHSSKSGILINNFSEKSFLSAINHVNDLENINKEHIRSCAKEIFDLKNGVGKYFLMYKKILGTIDLANKF